MSFNIEHIVYGNKYEELCSWYEKKCLNWLEKCRDENGKLIIKQFINFTEKQVKTNIIVFPTKLHTFSDLIHFYEKKLPPHIIKLNKNYNDTAIIYIIEKDSNIFKRIFTVHAACHILRKEICSLTKTIHHFEHYYTMYCGAKTKEQKDFLKDYRQEKFDIYEANAYILTRLILIDKKIFLKQLSTINLLTKLSEIYGVNERMILTRILDVAPEKFSFYYKQWT